MIQMIQMIEICGEINNDDIPAGHTLYHPEHSGRHHHQQDFARRRL